MPSRNVLRAVYRCSVSDLPRIQDDDGEREATKQELADRGIHVIDRDGDEVLYLYAGFEGDAPPGECLCADRDRAMRLKRLRRRLPRDWRQKLEARRAKLSEEEPDEPDDPVERLARRVPKIMGED